MHTVELLEQSLNVVQQLGYSIRHEWLDGDGGGVCEFGGKKWVFVDLAQSADEQLESVVEAILNEPSHTQLEITGTLGSWIQRQKAA